MRYKRNLRTATIIGVIALAGLGAWAGTSASATTTTTTTTTADDCTDKPAVPAHTETVPNPGYVEAVDPIQEVSYTVWKYEKHGGPGEVWVDNNDAKYVDANGVALPYTKEKDIPDNVVYYERTGKTDKVITQAYVPGKDAVGEPTIDVYYPEVPAVICPDPDPELTVVGFPPELPCGIPSAEDYPKVTDNWIADLDLENGLVVYTAADGKAFDAQGTTVYSVEFSACPVDPSPSPTVTQPVDKESTGEGDGD